LASLGAVTVSGADSAVFIMDDSPVALGTLGEVFNALVLDDIEMLRFVALFEWLDANAFNHDVVSSALGALSLGGSGTACAALVAGLASLFGVDEEVVLAGETFVGETDLTAVIGAFFDFAVLLDKSSRGSEVAGASDEGSGGRTFTLASLLRLIEEIDAGFVELLDRNAEEDNFSAGFGHGHYGALLVECFDVEISCVDGTEQLNWVGCGIEAFDIYNLLRGMNLDLVYSSSAGDLITASSCGDDVVAPTSVDGAAIFSGNEDVVEFGPDDIFDVFEGVALGMSGETFAKFEGNLDSSRGIEVGHSVGSLFAVESVGSIEPFENVVSFVADQDIVLGRGDCVLGRVGAEKDVALSHLVGSFCLGGLIRL
jgi:hypothetical protein